MVNNVGRYRDKQFGNYRLLKLLGEGGFAEVYLGEHIHLGSQAAIKVLTAKLTEDEVFRFRNEAQTIMKLQHPNIVQILDFSVEDGVPGIIMRYAAKGSLRQHHPEGKSIPLATIVSYVKQVASALQYVHNRKMIHRDIKPENMLVGGDNEILLSDFGIAAVAHSTQSSAMLDKAGTIAYMAPEQMQGKPRPASDQYSLGVVVYTWLTGVLPFQGTTLEIMTQHLSTPPQPLREKIPALSSYVEKVVLRALEKDPHNRFEDVTAFAQALEHASKVDASTLSHVTQQHVPLSEGSGATPVYGLITPQRHSTVYSNPPGTTLYTYAEHEAAVNAVVWSPDGLRIASASSDKTVRLWDASTGGNVLVYRNHTDNMRAVAWSPDGSQIASAGVDTSVQLWEAATGNVAFTFRAHVDSVHALAWSPNGQYIVAASRDKAVQMWSSRTGDMFLTYRGHAHSVFAVAWSPDGTRIASAGYDRTVQIWDATSGENMFTFRGHTEPINAVAWFADSTYVASAGGNTILVWEVTTGNVILTLRRYNGMIMAIAWSPDGSRLASTSGGIVCIWDMTTGENVLAYRGHGASVMSVAWSFDSMFVVSAGNDKTVRVWQAV